MPERVLDLTYLDQSCARVLPESYAGDILLWDIDKTYLDTHFSSFKGLLGIPFEFAIDKQTIAGSVPMLRALRRGPGDESAIVPLFFVSGSPVQLRKVIERRMTLDGVDFDGITFKDQFRFLLKGQPRGITEQIGYKLTALLLYRRQVPGPARWLMFGDDVESDAEVFLLFGEVCAGLRGSDLVRRLEQLGVAPRDIENVCALADPLSVTDDPVERVFIHLSTKRDPSSFNDPRIVATRSYLQSALVLYQMGRIRADGIAAVARTLRRRGASEREIEMWLEDARDRLAVTDAVRQLASGRS